MRQQGGQKVMRQTAVARSKLSPSRRRSTIQASSDRAAPMASASCSRAGSLKGANSGANTSKVASRKATFDARQAPLEEGRVIDELPGGDPQGHDLVEDLRQVLDHRGDADGQRPAARGRRRHHKVAAHGVDNRYEKSLNVAKMLENRPDRDVGPLGYGDHGGRRAGLGDHLLGGRDDLARVSAARRLRPSERPVSTICTSPESATALPRGNTAASLICVFLNRSNDD